MFGGIGSDIRFNKKHSIGMKNIPAIACALLALGIADPYAGRWVNRNVIIIMPSDVSEFRKKTRLVLILWAWKKITW